MKMSSPLNKEKNDMQPPPKRQRILPEGTFASPRSTQSRPISPSCNGKTTVTSSLSSSSKDSIRTYPDCGPIFTDVQEIDGCSSIESALGVPSRILFRQVGGDRSKPGGASNAKNNINKEDRRRLRPLLSRQEAEQFLRVTLLAQEIDVLVDLSETVLSRRQFARRFRREVLIQREGNAKDPELKDRPWKNPWLATLGPILDVLEKRQSNPSNENQLLSNQRQTFQEDILHHIHNELTRLYHSLQACGVYELERSAEQNRSLVTSLTDILGYTLDSDGQNDENDNGKTSAVRNLAREKHSLSKLQDLLAKRVRSLLVVLCHSRATSTTDSKDASNNETKLGAADDNGDSNQNDRKQILFDEQLLSLPTDTNIDNVGYNKSDSPMQKVSNEEDEESSILSLEEILTPLEAVCDELFDQADKEITSSAVTRNHIETDIVKNDCIDSLETERISGQPELASKEKQQQIQQETVVPNRTTNESFLLKTATSMSTTTSRNLATPASTVEDPDAITMVPLEASQRTVGAAAAILTLAGKAKPDLDENERGTNQPASQEMTSDPDMTVTAEPEASQRTVGAAATMIALAAKTGLDFTSQEELKTKWDDVRINDNSKADTGNNVNRNHPHTQQYRGDDDGSFIEDPPPSDREDGNNETTNKDEATSGKSANCGLGIFDIVDVFTPQSQS